MMNSKDGLFRFTFLFVCCGLWTAPFTDAIKTISSSDTLARIDTRRTIANNFVGNDAVSRFAIPRGGAKDSDDDASISLDSGVFVGSVLEKTKITFLLLMRASLDMWRAGMALLYSPPPPLSSPPSFPSVNGTVITGGSLSDALQICRSKARLLVVFIPSSKPGRLSVKDSQCLESLRSPSVKEATERKGGSFLVWTAPSDSNEATTARKRTKATTTKNTPVLLVAYPARVTSDPIKLIPKLLAQHHCNPPPTPTSAASWLLALRKRHSKQIAQMKLEIKEHGLYQERASNYQKSIVSDKDREKEETALRQMNEEEERKEEERMEGLEVRRKGFLEELGEEPEAGEGVVTIALRFAEKEQNSQRRFDGEDILESVFNWIDGVAGLERETILLTTMNGARTFEFEKEAEIALKDTGLGKMFAFRVTVVVKDTPEEEEQSEDQECDKRESEA